MDAMQMFQVRGTVVVFFSRIEHEMKALEIN